MLVFLVLFSLVLQVKCEDERELLGVDTKHIINKDTIITRNLKLGKRNQVKNTANEEERAPDWSYASIPDDVTKYVEQFKKNMSECLKEVHSSDRKVQRLSPRPESPVHGDCVIACVLKRNQIIVNKKVHKAVKIQKKLKGLRDAYTRDKNKKLKSGSGASTSKDYLYSHLLSFLDPMTRTRPLQSPGPETSDFDDPTNTDDGSTKSSKRAKKSNNDAEDKLIQILLQRMDYKHQNKDKSGGSEPEYNFALSLVDDLKAIHPDYKFDVRMEILGILKKYKQMSNYSQNYSGYYTTPQPQTPQNVTSQPAMSSTSTNDDNNDTETSIFDT